MKCPLQRWVSHSQEVLRQTCLDVTDNFSRGEHQVGDAALCIHGSSRDDFLHFFQRHGYPLPYEGLSLAKHLGLAHADKTPLVFPGQGP